MTISTIQQLRNIYVELCFQHKTKLSTDDFQKFYFIKYNTLVSPLTASMITGDLGTIGSTESRKQVSELAAA